MLAGKRILLGVTGGIAAYQAVDLTGLFRSHLADVRVIMTRAATRFITPLTLEAVSQHRVTVDMFGDTEYGNMVCGGQGWGPLARLDKIVAAAMDAARELDVADVPADGGSQPTGAPAKPERVDDHVESL